MSSPTPRRRALDRPIRPTRAEIDLGALTSNLRAARALVPRGGIVAVVKANAYGHGAVPVARALEAEGVEFLGVALVEEGIELRNGGIQAPILVLGGAYEGGYAELVEYALTPTVFRPEHLTQLGAAAAELRRTVDVHLKVDTGMSRLGVLWNELEDFLERVQAQPCLRVDGLMSHFASSDLEGAPLTQQQIERFRGALGQLRARGFEPRWRHLANSSAVLSLPEVRDGLELNLVRPGLMLYGLAPAPWLQGGEALRPVLEWKTAVTHLKTVPAGTAVSYGGTWVAARPSVIATLPVGYADGYSRRYSSRAEVLVRGRRALIAGRICMDLCMADVTDIPGVQVGDEVVLLGRQGEEQVSAQELAQLGDTISYEVLCGVGARVPRIVRGVRG